MNRSRIARTLARGIRLFVVAALLAVLANVVVPPPVAYAATLTVNNPLDVVAPDLLCSLREAIDNANANFTLHADCAPVGPYGADIINITAGLPVITLGGAVGEDFNVGGDLDISDNLTINGTGAGLTVIAGGGIDRVFHVVIPSVTVNINDLTVENGNVAGLSQNGGGILNDGGNVTITNCTVSANQAVDGGGIYNDLGGTLTVVFSDIDDSSGAPNLATNNGGGIYNTASGNVTVRDFSVVGLNNAFGGNGGGIYNQGILLLRESSIVVGNWVWLGTGGGIYNDSGDVTLREGSSVFYNLALAHGGGIYNSAGHVTLTEDTDVVFNAVGGNGGGIYNTGSLTLTQGAGAMLNAATNGAGFYNDGGLVALSEGSAVAGNDAVQHGGGIYNCAGGNLTIEDSDVAVNWAGEDGVGGGSGFGGGIYNTAVVTITGSIVDGNMALDQDADGNPFGDGGGIWNDGNLAIEDSTISNNVADGGSGDGGGNAGGICNLNQAVIRRSSIDDNTADQDGGGIWNSGNMELINCTVSDANLTRNGPGGGIYNSSGTLDILNVTLSDNQGAAGSSNIFRSFGTVNLQNTIVVSPSVGANCGGSVTSLGNNLDDDGTCVGAGPNDLPNTNPNLGSLQDNGGPTWTRALLPGSPAIDAGNDGVCPATDQRGVARPQGSRCDIGAYERGVPRLTKEVDDDTPNPGQRITYTITISNSDLVSVTNGLVSDTLPGGLNFVGPVTLDPPGAGIPGTAPPILAHSLTITAGTSVTLTFPVTVDLGLGGGTLITNTAAFTSAEVSPSVTGTATITIASSPAIAVTKTADVASANVGQTITYTYCVTNTGNATLDPVEATDDWLGPVTLDSTSLAPGVGTVGTLTYTVVAGDLPGPLANTVIVTGTPPVGPAVTATADESVLLVAPTRVYLPLVSRNHLVAPDLVVRQIVAAAGGVQVVIENQGNGPVTDEFWVDVYVNPDPAPTAVNQIWPDLASEGLVWGVTVDMLPGDVLTLTVGDAYYAAGYSSVSWPLEPGMPIYAQVDSYNADTTYGAVLERHEIMGEAYNNVAGPVVSSAAVSGVATSIIGSPWPDQYNTLPRRP